MSPSLASFGEHPQPRRPQRRSEEAQWRQRGPRRAPSPSAFQPWPPRTAVPAHCAPSPAPRCPAASGRVPRAPHQGLASAARPAAANCDLRPRHVLSRVLLRHYRGGFTGRGSIRPVFLRQRGQHVDIVLQLGGFGTRRIEVAQALRSLAAAIGDLTPQRVAAPGRVVPAEPAAEPDAGRSTASPAVTGQTRRCLAGVLAVSARSAAMSACRSACSNCCRSAIWRLCSSGSSCWPVATAVVRPGLPASCRSLRLAKLLERLEVFPDLCGFSAPRIEFI